jgi:hypothetical protein
VFEHAYIQPTPPEEREKKEKEKCDECVVLRCVGI